jgi:P pilus assembly chaperone PapD
METYLNRLFVLWLVIQVSCAYGQTSFQVESSRLFFNEPASGALPSTKLKVKNPGTSRLVIRASCADWQRYSLGDKIYSAPGTLKTSCCPFLTVQPETVELSPGQETELLITLSPTVQPKQMLNGMLMLTQINEEEWQGKTKSKAQIMFRMRIGVHLYYIPKNISKRSLSIDTLIVKKDAKETKPLRLRIHNTGDINLDSHVRFELTNLETSQEFTIELLAVNTMSTEKIWLSAELPANLPKGRYLIVAIVDSGPESSIEVAELETDITP